MKAEQAKLFAEAIVRAMRDPMGGACVIDLEEAAGQLWEDKAVWSAWLGGKRTRALREAMAEVDERTKGRPFRLDTPGGPLFLDVPLWRFAGRSGIHLSEEGCRPKARPSWDGEAEASRARAAA